MRRAVEMIPWGAVPKKVFRRDSETGGARHVRVTVDETKEYGFCLRQACVNFYLARDPNAPAHVAPIFSNHYEVWRSGQQTLTEGAYAMGGDRGGHYRPRSTRHDRSRSPRRDRSRSASPPRAIEANWPTRASSCAAAPCFGRRALTMCAFL